MEKTILILLDGCTYEGAKENLGLMEHLIEAGQGAKLKVRGELPSMSRPMYETLLTGLPVYKHLIVNNLIVRNSKEENVFSLCKKQGLKTAAAAYYWMSELYNKAPFNPLVDRIQLNAEGAIDNGIFYYQDDYPDSHLFNDAEFLRTAYDPDFLLIHPMNIDDAGHKFGSDSAEYALKVSQVDTIMGMYLPQWLEQGYQIVVTADHGMNEKKLHGGNTAVQREVALYIFSKFVKKGDYTHHTITELMIAPILCRLIGIQPSSGMQKPEGLGVDLFEV